MSDKTNKDQLVSLSIDDDIATLTLDDGDKNVLSPTMLAAINKALDEAENCARVLILTGRHEIFSAGFDLNILRKGNALDMLMMGFRLAPRLLAYPLPVVVACNGHAVAMGSFLLLSADYRIGSRGAFKIMANEVKIGLPMPFTADTLCRRRLSPAHYPRATLLSETYHPESAISAGFLDEVVEPEQLKDRAHQLATEFKELNAGAHKKSKLRCRRGLLQELKWANRKDYLTVIGMGLSRKRSKR